MKNVLKLASAAALTLSFAGTTALAKDHKDHKDIDAKFKKMDTNNDGKLSMDEFEEAKEEKYEAKFKKMDTNGDGFLTLEEKKAGWEEKKDKKKKM